jgi:regulator of nonsense transcripts 2
MDDDRTAIERFIQDAAAKIEQRRHMRSLNAQKIDNHDTSNLDSSIKKNSAFVRRLKVFSESQKTLILEEIDKLNLSRFISEIASSLIEAKLKLSDIPSVIEICTKLNRIYIDFHKQLLGQYEKYFPQVMKRQLGSSGPVGTNVQTNLVKLSHRANNSASVQQTSPSILNPSKLRVDLRIFAELIITGVLPLKEGFPILMNLLYFLMLHDKSMLQNANAILTFCKGCGDEYLGLVPKHLEELANKFGLEIPKSDFISTKGQATMRSFMRDYYQALVKNTFTMHEELIQFVAKNKKISRLRGEISKDLREQIEAKHLEFTKVNSILAQLGDILGETVPEFETTDASIDGLIAETFELSRRDIDSSLTSTSDSIWDDDGTRSFYEDLIDLRTYFPNLQTKASSSTKSRTETTRAESNEADERADGVETQSPSDEGATTNAGQELDDSESSTSSNESMHGEDDNHVASVLQMTKSVSERKQPEQYFAKLSDCVNRDMIDNAAIDFIKFFNSKFGRKKLIKTLFNVHRTRLDLLPFFARLAATIHPYVPSVGNELSNLLRHEFKSLFKKKDQINIESKVKNVRFIGELVKFNLFPKRDALDCLKSLLSDFTHHHIEMTCNLLEVCGRVLYKTPESCHQMRLVLEQMMRKKMLLSVDSKYVTMIENAYYFTNPPEVTRHVVEEPCIQIYIRYLLYDCLNRSTIDSVLSKMRKLNWNDRKLAKFTINCLIEAYNVKFYNIRYLAALLAALNRDHQWITIAVVDGVVEDLLLMMEINEVQFNQRRIPMIRYFGELYNYRLSDSSLVLKILYSLITYGVDYPDPKQNLAQVQLSRLDPPENLFRIKLICDLLDTSGQYFSSNQDKKKLDCYLLFFQRYYWCKRHIFLMHPYCLARSSNQFPAATEYLYNDTIRNLRPTFKMANSYVEATTAFREFIDSLKNELGQA